MSGQMRWVPQEQVTTPRDGLHRVIVNAWWLVDERGRVALYYLTPRSTPSPQCNHDRRMVEHRLAREGAAVGVVQLPVAFIPDRYDS